MDNKKNLYELGDIKYIKVVTIGSINPNLPFSDKERDSQVNILNKCLNDLPKGRIIGYDKTVATYMISEHQFVMEKTTYHIGFKRKPLWLEEDNKNGK
jgi:hypothetical protein